MRNSLLSILLVMVVFLSIVLSKYIFTSSKILKVNLEQQARTTKLEKISQPKSFNFPSPLILSPLQSSRQKINLPDIESYNLEAKLASLEFDFPKSPGIHLNFPSESEAILVTSLDKNQDYLKYHIYKRWPIASLTKLMTAIIAKEKLVPDRQIVISTKAEQTYGNRANIKAGQKYSVKQLINIMLICSSNDAAVALSETREDFVDLMNKKAKELNLNQTKFVEPTGLSPENFSSASDLKKLVRYIQAHHSEILEIGKKDNIQIKQPKGLKNFININKLRKIENFIGGKTGYIDESKENAISIFQLNGEKILVIVLGANDRYKQTKDLFAWLKQYKLCNSISQVSSRIFK